MDKIQFIETTPADLANDIKNTLIPELKEQLSKDFQPKESTEYLTLSEVCKLLQIDLSTLHRWLKDKKLTAYQKGSRIYFKCSEIDEYINKNKLP